ncbi:hypothetical protein [Modestobacter roseus]|nr:hypothetical protein [Modestobacter roseus]
MEYPKWCLVSLPVSRLNPNIERAFGRTHDVEGLCIWRFAMTDQAPARRHHEVLDMLKNCRIRLKLTNESKEIEATGLVALLIVLSAIALAAAKLAGVL